MASIHFRTEFGSNAVFTLESASDNHTFERFDTANRHRANALFDDKLNYASMKKRVQDGEIMHITLADSGSAEDENNSGTILLDDDLELFAVNKEGRLYA